MDSRDGSNANRRWVLGRWGWPRGLFVRPGYVKLRGGCTKFAASAGPWTGVDGGARRERVREVWWSEGRYWNLGEARGKGVRTKISAGRSGAAAGAASSVVSRKGLVEGMLLMVLLERPVANEGEMGETARLRKGLLEERAKVGRLGEGCCWRRSSAAMSVEEGERGICWAAMKQGRVGAPVNKHADMYLRGPGCESTRPSLTVVLAMANAATEDADVWVCGGVDACVDVCVDVCGCGCVRVCM